MNEIVSHTNKASEVTLEGGELVPPFPPGYLEKYVRTAKARVSSVILSSQTYISFQLSYVILTFYDITAILHLSHCDTMQPS